MIDGLTLPTTWTLADLEELERQCNAIGSAGDVKWEAELAGALLPVFGSHVGVSLAGMKKAMACELTAQKRLGVELVDRARFMVAHEHDDPAPTLILEVGGCRFTNPIDETLFRTGRIHR